MRKRPSARRHVKVNPRVKPRVKPSDSPLERKRSRGGVITLTALEISAQLAKQRSEEKQISLRKKSAGVRDRYKPGKRAWGKIVFVGLDGKLLSQRSRRKGILIYVSKKGRKELVKQAGKHGYAPSKRRHLELPVSRKLNKKFQVFRRRVLVGKGGARRPQMVGEKLIKGIIATNPDKSVARVNGRGQGEWTNDFSDKLVRKLTRNFSRLLDRQSARRNYVVAVWLLIESQDGEEHSIYFEAGFDAADHRSVMMGGIEAYIRKKFYAQLAKQLLLRGFVSSGSDNHIRKLQENAGLETDELQKDGDAWEARGAEVVLIKIIEWQIQQA